MQHLNWFESLPLLGIFGLTIVFVFLSIVVGMRLSVLTKAHPTGAETIGSVVAATLGLLAFMLAFTFNMTATRFDERKQLFLQEINAIGTAYLRAGLLPQPHSRQARDLFREYVDVRANAVRDPSALAEGIVRSESIHNQLWAMLENMVQEQPPSILQSLYLQSLNDVIDLHAERVTVGLQYRIPGTIWIGLYVVSALAMLAVGYQTGQTRRPQHMVNIVLALAFSAVILLIADLDRAAEGTVQVNQQPLFDLQKKIQSQS